MKSKKQKIQNILMKGMAITMLTVFTATPMVFAADSSLDDSNISLWDKLIYGTVGSTAKEIEQYFEKGPVIYISNEIQLRALAEYVNNGHDCSGKVIYLSNDIVVDSTQEWIPIGNVDNRFKGTFDGQGNAISGVNFNRNNKLDSEISNVGLFGYVENATIKNVTLADSKFDIPYEISNDILYKSNDIPEEFDGSIFSRRFENLGGIIGYNNSSIVSNCTIKDDVIITGLANVGGIVGVNYKGIIEKCSNNGDISGFVNVGGIAGRASGDRTNIKENNKIDFSKTTVSKVINCSNGTSATIYAVTGAAGGIVGSLTWNAIIQKCVNEGQIHITTEKITLNTVGTRVQYDPQNVGGIAGYVTGAINPDNNQKMYVAIDGCINLPEARVKGNQDVGGIAGQLGGQGGGYAILSNSINYSTDIVATNTTTGLGEAGYLIGEGGSRGWETDPSQTYDDAIAILYNNLYYVLTKVDASGVIGNKHQTTSDRIAAYGRFIAQRNTDTEKDPNPYYYDTETNVFVQKNDKYQIYKTFTFDTPLGSVPAGEYSDIDVSTMYPIYTNTNTTARSSAPNYGGNTNVKVEDGLLYDYNNTTGELTIKSAANGQLVDSSSNTTVSYTIFKKAKGESNYTEIKGNSYFKTGDTIKITAKFNRYLASAYGPLTAITTAPILKMNNSVEMVAGNLRATQSSYITTVDYTYEVQQGDSFDISNLTLKTTERIYAISGSDYIDNHPYFGSRTITSDIPTIKIDTVAPIINTKVYVENALETGRYTTGKEVLIEVKTNEAIQVTDKKLELPEIQVGFSKSGTGKYNYDTKNNKVGYAKPKSANIAADGTVTWVYSYQIQEGDEGDIQLEYKAGKITDLAGNETDIAAKMNLPTATHGNNKNITDIEISKDKNLKLDYEVYKNGTKLTDFTDITKLKIGDILKVKATFNKGMYTQYGNTASGTSNIESVKKETAPILKLNDAITMTCSRVSVTPNKSTVIEYSYTVNAEAETQKINTLSMQRPAYYCTDSEQTIQNTNDSNKNNVLVNGGATIQNITDLNLVIDTIGAEVNVETIYVDTTAPTVEIIAKDIENNITNKDVITYEFKWSEELAKEDGRTFGESDITVNNASIVADSFTKEPIKNSDGTYTYKVDVTPDVASGNIGDVQVIVEKGACQDLVGHENVRTEKIITVDKQAPTVEITADKDYVKVNDIITYTFNWSEAVKDFGVEVKAQEATESTPAVEAKAGIKVNNANVVENSFTKVNDSQYTLQVKPTNGNDVEVIINNGICTDIAGNANISNKNIIQVIPTVTISTNKSNPTNESEITYTFTWSEKVEGFTKEDIIVNEKATKGDLIDKGNNTFTMTVNYESIIPNGNEGEVIISVPENSVQDSNGNGNAYTTNTTKIDRIAPILISLEAYGTSNITVDQNVDSVKQYYKVGDTVTVVATFSENIENTTKVPILALQFSESGNAKGKVSEGTINGNKITYTYTIQDGDKGTLSVKGFTGNVIDSAGNETVVTKRNLDGDTIIADTIAPKLVGITAIAPDFEYDELLENPGDTKRYGQTSKTREKNTITIIAEYSENVYNLDSSKKVNTITNSTAPVLKLKFGTSGERTATFNKIEGSKVYYTYDITSGDNGNLIITSLAGTVSDIAGNTYTTNTSLPASAKYEVNIAEESKVDKITADTTKPVVTISHAAVDKDDNGNTITGNGNHYRKGSIITITATTNEYVYNKNSNNDLTKFTKENILNIPDISLKFGDVAAKGTVTKKDVKYEAGKTIFTYEYTIQENDNGRLNISIADSVEYDIALNGNSVKTQSISTISADTVNPVTNWQSWVESEQYGIVDNQNGTWTVTFSETLYTYNPNTHTVGGSVNTSSAPILLVSKDNVTPLETRVSSVTTNNGKTVITYTYSPYTKNIGAYGMKFASVSDKAGNLFNYKDQQAPTLSNIKVTNPATGTYKAGTQITIVATFNEKITGTAPTLKLKFGDKAAKGTVSGGTIGEDGKTITYQYTITEGDNGLLSLESYTGTGLKDLADNAWVAPETITLSGNRVTADTIAPTLTITSNVEKTNQDKVTYTFTWSEDVKDFTIDDIEVINGSKGTFTKVNNKVYTLEVDTTSEGRQIVKVNANVCQDIAGNPNTGRVTYNKVVIDYTKPEIRAKVNGGNYVIDTDSKKSTLKETIVVNEEVSKFEYIWTKDNTIPTTGFTAINPDTIQVNSDIHLNKQVTETGTYYLYVKVTDKAGNVFEGRTNGFIVANAQITLTPNTQAPTNQDVTVAISYGQGLTENRKAGIQGKTQSADATKVIAVENGTVYAEATDVAGNKVYVTLEITNIDKTAPEATIEYTENEDGTVTATVSFNEDTTITNNEGKNTYTFTKNGEFTFEFKDKVGNKGVATAKVTTIKEKEPDVVAPPVEEDKTAPEITFNYTTTTATVGTAIGATITTNEDAMIEYSWDNKNWTSSQDFTRSINARRTPTSAGTYMLYAKATDKASNTSKVSTLQFTVVKSDDDILKPEVIFEDLTTIQKDGVKYVKVSPNYTTAMLTAKMNKEALLGKTPEYKNLTESKGLKTGSEIAIDGNTKYIVIVNGDVNCDGKIDFLGDIVMINNYRIGVNQNLREIQILAGDINNSGSIDFIPDIVAMNNYRLGRINVL